MAVVPDNLAPSVGEGAAIGQGAMTPGSEPRSFTVFDIIGIAFGGFGLLWSTVVAVKVAPAFANMFADFGGELPAFTNLCLSPWFPLVIGSIPLGVAGLGALLKATRRTRAILMGVTILLSLAMPGIFLVGMYLPVFSIAGSIK